MARKEGNFEKIKRTILPVISGLAFLLFLWLFVYGKVKAENILSPIFDKIPKDEVGLVKTTEDILGEAVERVKGDNIKKAVEKGSEFFEESDYAQPAREARNEVKRKIDETVESAKEFPAKELKHVQRQVCKEWLGEEVFIATQSAD